MKQANVSNYGNYSSDNYGAHTLVFTTAEGEFFFSYETLVAFRPYTKKAQDNGHGGLFVSVNRWGTTTGKHLNWIDGGNKKERLSSEEFDRIYSECFDA